MPIAPVPLHRKEGVWHLIRAGLDFLQADDVRAVARDPFLELRVTRPDAVHVPGGDLHVNCRMAELQNGRIAAGGIAGTTEFQERKKDSVFLNPAILQSCHPAIYKAAQNRACAACRSAAGTAMMSAWSATCFFTIASACSIVAAS